MSLSATGMLLGGCAAGGALLITTRVAAARRPRLASRVLPYVRELDTGEPALEATGVVAKVFGPSLQAAAGLVDRVVGGTASVRRRLDRCGRESTVAQFRREQVLWGLVALAGAALFGVIRATGDPGTAPVVVVVCGVAFVAGVLARDQRLSAEVKERERRIVAEFPVVAELLALSVAAGEGPVAALHRVVSRAKGELAVELGRVLADVRAGEPVTTAFDRLAARSSLAAVARFSAGVAVAVERGTPLADVLHAQAADVREAGRRELIEVAARKEVLMMVPIVFLVLPTVVVIALFPGIAGLHLS